MAHPLFGSEYVWKSSNPSEVSIAVLDSTHFVIAYLGGSGGAARVGTVSGNTISYGAENSFNGATYTVSVAALDSTHFVVTYRDAATSNNGNARIGVVSGNTISSYGTEATFVASAIETYVDVLDSTHFVVAYINGIGLKGTARIGSVSGTTISYGATNIFSNVTTDKIEVAALDSTHFVTACSDNYSKGQSRVGVVSGTSISSYGATNCFNNADTTYISIDSLDSTHFVVCYKDDGGAGYGESRIGLVSGTTISSYGSEVEFNSAITDHISVTKLDDDYFAIGYKDAGNSNYGTSLIGHVTGTSIDSYGTEVVFNAGETDYIDFALLNYPDFIAAYRDVANSNYGTALCGKMIFFVPQINII